MLIIIFVFFVIIYLMQSPSNMVNISLVFTLITDLCANGRPLSDYQVYIKIISKKWFAALATHNSLTTITADQGTFSTTPSISRN